MVSSIVTRMGEERKEEEKEEEEVEEDFIDSTRSQQELGEVVTSHPHYNMGQTPTPPPCLWYWRNRCTYLTG